MTTGSKNSESTPSKVLRSVVGGRLCEAPTRMGLRHTGFGGTRTIDMLVGDPLPRVYQYVAQVM